MAHQDLLSLGFLRQEYWSRCYFLCQWIFPTISIFFLPKFSLNFWRGNLLGDSRWRRIREEIAQKGTPGTLPQTLMLMVTLTQAPLSLWGRQPWPQQGVLLLHRDQVVWPWVRSYALPCRDNAVGKSGILKLRKSYRRGIKSFWEQGSGSNKKSHKYPLLVREELKSWSQKTQVRFPASPPSGGVLGKLLDLCLSVCLCIWVPGHVWTLKTIY